MDELTNKLQSEQQTPAEEPELHEESLEELSTKREYQIRQKKVFFNKIKTVVLLLTIVGVGVTISYIIYERQRTTAPVKPVVIENPEDNKPTEEVSIWELHRDDNLKVFIKIPPDAKLFTHTDPSKIEVVYARNESDFSKINETNLTDGYIFRVTPLSLGVRDLGKITEIKQDSFKTQCPPTASISAAQDSLDTVDAKYFTVANCNVEYIVSYVPRFGIFYEIAQIYRGDIGIGQQYRAKTQELLNTFRFFPEDSPKPYDPNITYYNESQNFSIKYPDNMDTNCCTLDGPAKANDQSEEKDTGKLLVASYLPTYKDPSNFDGFALYLVKFNSKEKMTFDSYINEQKLRLFEDYKVVKGTEPVGSEEDVQVGTLTAKMLKGYQWQGTDIIYVDLSKDSKKQVYLAIVIKNLSGDEFKQVMDKILGSFEYFPNLNK